MDLSPDQLDDVARTVLSEGGGEGDAGMAAIAQVVLNRTKSAEFPNNPSDVVHQPRQFSAWNLPRSDPNNPNGFGNNNPDLQHARQIVSDVWSGNIPDQTNNALYYGNVPAIRTSYNAAGKPMPAFTTYPQTAQIGKHTFFGSPNDDPQAVAKSLGIDPSLIVASKPQYAPVSSGGGVTVMLPSGGTQSPTTDSAEIARSLGIDPSLIVAKPQLPANMQPPPAADIHATPEIQAAAAPVAKQLGFPNAMVEGMPIVGPLFSAAGAATGAAMQGMFTPNAPETFAQRFTRNFAIQQEAQRQWDAAHPVQALAGNLAGGAMITGPLGATNPGAALLGLPNATRLGATVGGRIWTGATGGAAIGGTDAALRGENPVTGMEIGAAGGAAGPAIGEAAGNALTAISNAARTPAGALAGINPIGRGWLANAVANETPASIAAAQERMGPQGFLADLNPALTEVAAGIANRPEPPGSSAVGEAYRARQAAQRTVTENALTSAFGNKIDIEGFKNAITENRKAAADPLYAQWRSMQVRPTPALEALVPRLESTGAFDEAKYLGAAKGISLDQRFFTKFAAGAGAPGLQKEFPTTETWDLVKRGLDSKIEQAYTAGNKTRAAALLQLKGELIDEIGKTNAGQVWNQARSEFADRSALLDNVDAGRDTFLGSRSGLSVDQLKQDLRGLSGPELAARIVGARSAADEVMGATRNGDTTLRNKFLAPNNQEKLRLLLGDDRANNLIRTVEQQDYLAGQAKYVNPRAGSPTAPRTAAINALEAPPAGEWNLDFMKPLSFIPPSIIEAMRPSTILQGGKQARYASARQQIVPALLARGNALSDLISAIHQESAARSVAAQRGSLVARNVAATTLPLTTTARLRGNFKTNPLIPAAQ